MLGGGKRREGYLGRARRTAIRLLRGLSLFLAPILRPLAEARVQGVLPIFLYACTFCAVCSLLFFEVRNVLNLHAEDGHHRHRRSQSRSSSMSPAGTERTRGFGRNSAPRGGGRDGDEGGDEDLTQQHHLADIPKWVMEPAATGASAPDPMEGIKVCLFEGKTLPECTEAYRTKEPTSGVQGLQALLVKGMDTEVASAHAKAASVVRQRGQSTGGAEERKVGLGAGVKSIRGSGAHVADVIRRSNATWRALEISHQETHSILLALLSAERNGAALCKTLWTQPLRESKGYEKYRDGFSLHGADRYLADEIFLGKRDGFFVDIGAADGLPPSNSLLLELCYGWKGLCVDPQIHHTNHRPSCSTVHTAISATEGAAKLWHVASPDGKSLSVLESAISNEHIDEIAAAVDMFGAKKEELHVQAAHLPAILDTLKAGREVDLLAISVGSGMKDAIKGCDIPSVRPAVVVVGTELCPPADIKWAEDFLTREGFVKRRRLPGSLVFQRL